MRQLVVGTFLSLDGVMQAPGGPDEDRDGNFPRGGWLVPFFDEKLVEIMTGWAVQAGAFLLGRRTYEIFAGSWPNSTDPSDLIATALNTRPKFVASRTLKTVGWNNSRLLGGDVAGEVSRTARPRSLNLPPSHMPDSPPPRAASTHPFVPLAFHRRPVDEMLERAANFSAEMARRRTTRHFSPEPVPRELIEHAIRTAGTAPSGAHQQPWTFVAVSDPELKRRIREAAEREEAENYRGRMPPEWLEALAPLGTDMHKAHLTDAPWIVVLFRHAHGMRDGVKRTHYYTQESCGIAAGFFIAAVHHMGLATLTHTPTPMGFLGELLERPPNEKAMLVMPVGHPAPGAMVPDIRRKVLEEIAVWR